MEAYAVWVWWLGTWTFLARARTVSGEDCSGFPTELDARLGKLHLQVPTIWLRWIESSNWWVDVLAADVLICRITVDNVEPGDGVPDGWQSVCHVVTEPSRRLGERMTWGVLKTDGVIRRRGTVTSVKLFAGQRCPFRCAVRLEWSQRMYSYQIDSVRGELRWQVGGDGGPADYLTDGRSPVPHDRRPERYGTLLWTNGLDALLQALLTTPWWPEWSILLWHMSARETPEGAQVTWTADPHGPGCYVRTVGPLPAAIGWDGPPDATVTQHWHRTRNATVLSDRDMLLVRWDGKYPTPCSIWTVTWWATVSFPYQGNLTSLARVEAWTPSPRSASSRPSERAVPNVSPVANDIASEATLWAMAAGLIMGSVAGGMIWGWVCQRLNSPTD